MLTAAYGAIFADFGVFRKLRNFRKQNLGFWARFPAARKNRPKTAVLRKISASQAGFGRAVPGMRSFPADMPPPSNSEISITASPVCTTVQQQVEIDDCRDFGPFSLEAPCALEQNSASSALQKLASPKGKRTPPVITRANVSGL